MADPGQEQECRNGPAAKRHNTGRFFPCGWRGKSTDVLCEPGGPVVQPKPPRKKPDVTPWKGVTT